LIGAGLFVRSLHNLHGVVAGFDPGRLLQFDINPTLAKIEPAKVAPLFEQMIERIESIPGVQSASVSSGGENFLGFKDKISGRSFRASYAQVRENFFETMGIPLIAGRGFSAADNQAARQVVIVNEAFVHQYFPDASPLGQTANGEIIGVVRDSKLGRLREGVAPAIYYSYRQGGYGRMTFRIRTKVNPDSVIPAVRQAVQQVDSHLPLSNVRTLAEQVDQTLAKEKMFAGLSTLFGVLALVLTCVGFYGILAYGVARRTNEIGIRMALGAKRFDVLRLVMSEGLFLVLIGSAVGVCGALASTGYIASILFNLEPNDGLTITLAVLLMVGIAVAAAFLPARKASRIDPLVAVRYE
jgi:predicted permease